ncbi:MAG: PEP-CTERM sorting domain-containing protein [Armatimonadota bacterium]
MRFAFVALFGFTCSFGLAAPFARVLSANQQIRNVDMVTQTEPLLFTTGLPSESLAVSIGGTQYFADPVGNLWTPTSSGSIPAGSLGFGQIGDLDWANNGLWGFSNANQSLFFYDLGSASVTASYSIPSLSSLIVTGVAFRPTDSSIFLSARQGLNNDFLFQVPSSSSTANLIGSMPISDAFSYVADIDFDPTGTLYAVSFYHRDFYSVNVSTAATSFISTGPHRDVYAMALNPTVVPEPGTILGLAAGICGYLRRRKSS